jgi:CD63 antigen
MTGLTGSANFMKYSLFFFNFLFVITGIILLSIGLVVQGAFFGYEHFLESQFYSIPALLIATGIIIFFVAFFGCYGAFKENYCMVLTFSCLLICIFILELAGGIAGYVLRDQTEDLLKTSLHQTIVQYNGESYVPITKLWDNVQSEYECCGVESSMDWVLAKNNSIPMSCCVIPPGQMDSYTCNNETTSIHGYGCAKKFGNFIKAHAVTLGAAGISIAIVQFVGIFFACYIAKKLKDQSSAGQF